MVKSVMQCIQEYISMCPYLDDFEGLFPQVGIDNLEENTTAYMVERIPADPVVKAYVDGSSIRQEVFLFSSREIYASEETDDIHAFYDAFADWLEKSRNDLKLPLGCEVRKLKATTGGYIYNEEGTKAQYQIQCRLEYYRKGVN